MTKRIALVLALAAGSVQAQDVMKVTYSWVEVEAGTNVPVASPNGILEPGEGARIGLTVQALHNGTDAIGQMTSYSGPGVGSGMGPIRCIASVVYDVVGSGGDATGAWNSRCISSTLPAGAFNGLIWESGARVHSIGGGQFLFPGTTANGTNPVTNAWRGVWNPTSFVARTVTFKAEPSDTTPVGQQNGVYVQVGTDFLDPEDPSTEFAIYYGKYLTTDFGDGISIPISPNFVTSGGCYANCDESSTAPILNVGDFQCFLNKFAAGDDYANCDESTIAPVLNVNDFMCYVNKFSSGCE